MARTIVLLAVLAVVVNCQSGCGSIDAINIPYTNSGQYTHTAVLPVLNQPNGRVSILDFDNDDSTYFYRPFVSSLIELYYSSNSYFNDFTAHHLQLAQDFFANNSTADRKVLILSVANAPLQSGEDTSVFIAAARRLKQSGVEIVVFAESNNFRSIWEQVASPNKFTSNFYDRIATNYLAGVNASTCAIMGANPRIATFDQNNYVFNGLGDYWLVKSTPSSDGEPLPNIQVRMGPCDNTDPSSGTCTLAAAVNTGSNILILYFDPQSNLLTMRLDGDVVERDINGLDLNLNGYNINALPITTADSNTGYVFQLYGDGGILGFYVGEKSIVNAWFAISPINMGAVTGLCGTYDGCSANDYYSADQVFVNPGDSAANIYNGFAETWRVKAEESLIGNYDFDANSWYNANYPEYSKNWNPRMDAIPVTTTSSQACEKYAEASKYLYQVCTDSVALDAPEYNFALDVTIILGCLSQCQGQPQQFSFLENSYCEQLCSNNVYDWDYFGVYNDTNIPHYSLNLQNTYGATAQFVLGGTYTIGYGSDYCYSEFANATVTITCDESPIVDAGQDIHAKRNFFSFPAIFLSQTASDVNTNNLEYAWRVIEAPMARNTTGQDGYWNPQGYNSVVDVELYNAFHLGYFLPEYPGIYVFEVAAYDGCSVSYDTVMVNVTCDDCGAPVVSAYPSANYLETTSVNGYSNVGLSSTPNDYSFASDINNRWVLESTTTGLEMELVYTSNKVYNLYQVFNDQVINTTVDITNTTGSFDDSFNGIVSDGDLIYRYEGEYEMFIHTETLDVTTTTSVYLSEIDSKVLTCVATIVDPTSRSGATFTLQNQLTSPDFYPDPFCNGDYNFRVDYSDACFDADAKFAVTHACAESPVAQLVTCDPNWKYDYVNLQWPSTYITLDARDSYSPSGNGVPLYYLYETLTQPTWESRGSELYEGAANTYTWNTPADVSIPMLSQTATYEFQVSVRDDCSFSVSDKASVHLSCDDQSPVLTTSTATILSSDGSATFNQFTLNATASSNPHDTISGYLFDLVSGDPDGVSGGPFPSSGPVQTFALLTGGTYTFNVMTFDGCWWKNSTSVTVTYQCDAAITPAVVTTPAPSAAYDTATDTWPTFTLDGTGSTVNANRMLYNWDVTTPSGGLVTGVSNSQTLTLDTTAFQEVGAYVATFTLTDGCRTVVGNYTVTVTCAALPTVTIMTSATVTNGTNVGTLTWYTSPQTTGSWIVYDSNGNYAAIVIGQANVTVAATTTRTYTGVFSYGNGCQSTSLNRTLSATCQWNPTFPLTTSTSTWTHNRFPKFSLAPTVTGENPDVPAYGVLDYTYRVLSAPVGSIWAPINSTVTNTTLYANVTYPVTPIGDTYVRFYSQTYRTTTVTTTKVVTLVNGNEWFEGCFAADIAGDYTLQLTVTGYCSEYITSTVTVSARCNTSPVARASYTENVVTGASFYDSPYVIDGLSSTDADGDNLTYYWEVVSVPDNSPYMLNDSNTQNIIQNRYLGRTQILVYATGTYGLRLTVSDGCSNSTSDLSVVVACNNNLAIVNPQQSHVFDGFTPVSMSQFTFVATDRCDLDQYWDVIAFTPAEKVTPPTPEPTSGSSQVALSLFVLFALIVGG